MSADVLPESSQSPRQEQALQQHASASESSSGRGWRRALIVLGVLAILASAAAFIPAAISTPEVDQHLTHTIRRGDLLVTVTEQGTLESSNNTEIKCKVRGFSMVTWVIPGGTIVKPGDELVRLDTKVIEEQFSLTKTDTFIATATLARTQANVTKAEIAIEAYKEGRFKSTLEKLEMELAAKIRNLDNAQKMLGRSETLFKQGYVTELEVAGNAFTVTQAELELKVKETEIVVLNEFTKQMMLVTLNGNITASNSKLAADQAGLAMEIKRRNRAEEELADCLITADRSGLVIYPSAAAWKRTPDITEGATVRKDQILLLMPDLSKMQVKVGIHESMIEQIHPGLDVIVTLPDRTLEAKVSTVASVTRPAGWWTGNVVKYDTIIELPPESGLKPGMSAEVEVIMAVHKDVLTIPVAAVVETDKGAFCWVTTDEGTERRVLQIGDSNDVFVVVEAGLKVGDKVALNPVAFLEEAEVNALKTLAETKRSDRDSAASDGQAKTE